LPLAACRLPLAACRLPLAACRLPLASLSPLVAILVSMGIIAAVMGSVWLLTRSADSAAMAREQTLVDNGLAGRMQEAENAAKTETMWDDAMRNLDLKLTSFAFLVRDQRTEAVMARKAGAW
jgi:hypothetical protein